MFYVIFPKQNNAWLAVTKCCIGKIVGAHFSVVITTFDRLKDTNGNGKPLWQITTLSVLKQQKTNFLFNPYIRSLLGQITNYTYSNLS